MTKLRLHGELMVVCLFFRFMTLFTDTIIGKDLERGLNNLKQKLEKINN